MSNTAVEIYEQARQNVDRRTMPLLMEALHRADEAINALRTQLELQISLNEQMAETTKEKRADQ